MSKKKLKYIEDKTFEIRSYVSIENGQSYYPVKCPFCGNKLNIQVWSATTTGKKCDCFAVLRRSSFTGDGYAQVPIRNQSKHLKFMGVKNE